MLEIQTITTPEVQAAANAIRQTVFVIEQNVDEREEYDEFEATSTHYLALWNNEPVGTCRWRYTDKGIKLERFAVLKNHRGTGAGAGLLLKCIEEIKNLNKPVFVYLHAQLQAEGFYQKYGFIAQGDVFYEANIPHHKMSISI